jgi:hypothetical protein
MTEKQGVMDWLIENNKFGKDAAFLEGFEKELEKAIEKEEEVITTWMFGNLLFKDEKYYELRWNLGKFVVQQISKEDAEYQNLGERSIITFEKELGSSKETNDFRNTSWFKEIEEIYHTFSLIIDDKYSPGSRQEIENAKLEVAKLKGKYSGDAEFDKEIAYLDDLLNESIKRKFNGSKFTIIGVFIGILFMFYMSNRVETKSGSLLIDKAEGIQQDKIVKLKREIKGNLGFIEGNEYWYTTTKKEISDLKSQEQTNQIIERIGEKEKQIVKYEKQEAKVKADNNDKQKEIDLLSSMTAEEYRDYKVNSDQKVADSVSGYAWTTVLWFILYIGSTFPFVYTINKRGGFREKKSGWLKVIGVVLGSAQTVRYRRSDGSTYNDNSSYVAALAVSIALPATAIVLTIVLLPYIATIAFARNIVIPYFYSI